MSTKEERPPYQYNHIVLHDMDANPLISLVADVKETRAVEDVTNLLIFVKVPYCCQPELDAGAFRTR